MTDSDIESDEEFQATLSYVKNELLDLSRDCGEQCQWDCWSYERKLILGLLTSQIASGRVDRVEIILLLVMPFHQEETSSKVRVDEVIYHAMSQAASRGNLGAIRMICRITAGFDLSIAKQHAAIRILLFQNESPSCVEALRELGFNEGFSQVFDLIKSGVGRQVFGRYRSTPSRSFTILQWNFFVAALSGNLEEVKRILDDQQTDLRHLLDVYFFRNTRWGISDFRVFSTPLCAAAARGHWKVVKAILAKLTEAESLKRASSLNRGHLPAGLPLPKVYYLYQSVVIIAAQRNDISIFSEKFADLEKAISRVLFVPVLLREARPEFMEELRQLRIIRPQKYRGMGVRGEYLKWLMRFFPHDIRCHPRPCHVDFILQEMFEQNVLSVKVLAPFLLHLLLATKRVSVVKRVLLFKPRFFIDGADLDLEDYKFDRCSESLWTRGVRLLVEAGVKLRPPVPAEHTELFSLSLQDRCLITVRVCLKLPVRESVQKLPLTPTLKRRLLYRF